MIKADGTIMIWSDADGYKVKPLNWMTPPTAIDFEGEPLERIVVRKRAGSAEDRLEISVSEVVSDQTVELDHASGLEKDGVERHLQEALAARPGVLEDGLRLVRREWATDIGPVDLVCRDPGLNQLRRIEQVGK